MFEGELKRFCDVLAPVAKAIKCLESGHSTATDVFLFFIAIAASYKEFLSSGAQGLPVEDQEAIRRSINYRFRQQIDDNQYDIYFSAFMLDPRKPSYMIISWSILTSSRRFSHGQDCHGYQSAQTRYNPIFGS
jgi:hypothetical protein